MQKIEHQFGRGVGRPAPTIRIPKPPAPTRSETADRNPDRLTSANTSATAESDVWDPDEAWEEDESQKAAQVWADLTRRQVEVLAKVFVIARDQGVPIHALAEQSHDFVMWIRETDALHLAECDDPECTARVCRKARGLPPLTRKEIEAMCREAHGLPVRQAKRRRGRKGRPLP